MLLNCQLFIKYFMLITNTNFLKILVLSFIIIYGIISTCWSKYISKDVNKSGFSCPISSKKTKYLSFFYCKIDFIQGIKLTLFNFISFDKISHLYHDIFWINIFRMIWMLVIWNLVTKIEFFCENILLILTKNTFF